MRDAKTLHGTIDTRVKLWARRTVYRTEIAVTVSTFDTPGISPSVFSTPPIYREDCLRGPPFRSRGLTSFWMSNASYPEMER